MKYPNGSESVLSRGPWSQLVQVRGAVCADGRARSTCRLGVADTYWSAPAAVRVKGKTVSGFVFFASGDEGWQFIADPAGRNAHLLGGV